MNKMPVVQTVKTELSDLIKENVTEYKADENTLGKNFRRTLLGLGAYYLVKWIGPDSNAFLETMTWVTEKAALVYTFVRGYQTIRDFFKYI